MNSIELIHPTERSLGRFVSNEMGPRGRKSIKVHLDGCPACRDRTMQLRDIARRFRDLEKTALAYAAYSEHAR